MIQFKIRLEIGAYGNRSALEFILETDDAVDTDGDVTALIIVSAHISAVVGTEMRAGAEPYPVNPFLWFAVVEAPGYYQTGSVNSWAESVDTNDRSDLIFKKANEESYQR